MKTLKNILRLPRSTHSGRLERWLGAEAVEQMSRMWRGYHGPDPMPLANVPGGVFVTNDGDFVGPIAGGGIGNLVDYYAGRYRSAVLRAARRSQSTLHGFSSVSDLLSEITTGGKLQVFPIAKAGVTGVVGVANSLWDVGNQPSAGGTSAAPAGSTPDNTTAGGLKQSNAAGGDTLHFLGAQVFPDAAVRTLLLYDRFFQVNHDMTVDPRTVTGVSSRYQDTTAKGAFITHLVTTVLPAATPTYTITYIDQDGNTAEAASAQTIVSGAIARRFPYAAAVGAGWYIPLNSGDTGVRAVTNLDLSAAMASGATDVVLGKPIAMIPCPTAGVAVPVDASISPMMAVKVVDNACLALLEMSRNSTGATNYGGLIWLGSG